MDAAHAVGVATVFVLAGGVKGITGMGLPTVAVSLLVLWMPPTDAAALLVAPSLATNIAQCRGPHLGRLAVTLWPAWLALALAALLTPESWSGAAALDAGRLLGMILVLYGMWGLWRPTLPDLSQQVGWAGAVAGAATGLLTALTAVFAFPLVPFLQTLRLDKDAMIQALGLSFTVATLALAVRLHTTGSPMLLSAHGVLALGAAFAGIWLGNLIRARISGPAFQRALFAVFIALGATNLVRAP